MEVSLAWSKFHAGQDPAGAVELMAEVACFPLTLAPYLDLLDEAAVLEPASAGTTRT